jgi:hypothetical protein
MLGMSQIKNLNRDMNKKEIKKHIIEKSNYLNEYKIYKITEQNLDFAVDNIEKQLALTDVSHIYTKNDLRVAFEQSRCNKHSFEDWYKYNYC